MRYSLQRITYTPRSVPQGEIESGFHAHKSWFGIVVAMNISVSDLSIAVDALLAGEVIVMPTDTVYGVCARALDEQAVQKLYNLKDREYKPGTVIAASVDQLVDLGIKRRYLTAVADYWPGSISIEIPHSVNYLNQATGRQAFRIVGDKELVKLLDRTGPLVTSSANLAGQPTSNTIDEAKKYFGGKIDTYIDGGDLSGAQPSTLIRVVDDIVEVIREGSVKIDESGRIS